MSGRKRRKRSRAAMAVMALFGSLVVQSSPALAGPRDVSVTFSLTVAYLQGPDQAAIAAVFPVGSSHTVRYEIDPETPGTGNEVQTAYRDAIAGGELLAAGGYAVPLPGNSSNVFITNAPPGFQDEIQFNTRPAGPDLGALRPFEHRTVLRDPSGLELATTDMTLTEAALDPARFTGSTFANLGFFNPNTGSGSYVVFAVDAVSVTLSTPEPVDDHFTVAEDSGATTLDVLANDVNADGAVVSNVSQPANGVATVAADGRSVDYQPDADYCSPDGTEDIFTYSLDPGTPGEAATVSVSVTCVDDAPAAVDDDASVPIGAGPTAIDVLANDTDIDGGPLFIAAVTQPANGTVLVNAGSSAPTYEPTTGYCNDGGPTDDFTYSLNAVGGPTATVRVEVRCDEDGVPASEEDGAPNDGDGNEDGIADSRQVNVASKRTVSGEYAVVVSSDGTRLRTVTAADIGSVGGGPVGVSLPDGLISYSVEPIGGALPTTTVEIIMRLNPRITTFYKYGPLVPGGPSQWYDFAFDGETGAIVTHGERRTRITLHFVDGKRGDADLLVNNTITDPGGAGFVEPTCTIVGTPGDDVLTGTDGDDVICGLGGNDVIMGLDGDDIILGGEGSDWLDGGQGEDWVDGGSDDDDVLGGRGDDVLLGGSGADSLDGGRGADDLYGEAGDDSLVGSMGDDFLNGGAGNDLLDGGRGDDRLIP